MSEVKQDLKDVFKKGQEVYSPEGITYTIEVLDGKTAICALHEQCRDGDGETWTEAGEMLVRVPLERLLVKRPEIAIPTYLQRHIDRAEQTLDTLKKTQQTLREEIDGLRREKWQVTEEMRKYPHHVVRQLELFERHLAGEDLLVCWEQYGKLYLQRMSEIKHKDYGVRMVGLWGDYGDREASKWIPLYDWSVHQYSDDSGSKFHALVAGDEAEMKVRVREFLDARAKGGFNIEARSLRAYKGLGIELNEKELKIVAESDAALKKQAEDQRARDMKRLQEQADKLGVTLGQPSSDGQK